MCFTVVSAVSRYVAESPVRAPIRFVFDEQQGVDVDVEMFFSEMIKSLPAEAQNLIDGLPAFKSDKGFSTHPYRRLISSHGICAASTKLVRSWREQTVS